MDAHRAVHGRDHRHLDVEQVGEQAPAVVDDVVPVSGGAQLEAGGVDVDTIVVAGAGHDHDLVVAVPGDLGEAKTQLLVRFHAPDECPAGGMKRHRQNAVFTYQLDVLVALTVLLEPGG